MNREKKWTPGPWTVMAHGAITLIYGNTERCDRVAKIMIMDKNGVRKANAALISAAPELVEALENLTGLIKTKDDRANNAIQKWVEISDAALAKAYGEVTP